MLRSIGTRMGEGWLGHLQKSGSTVRVLQVFGCENMNIPVHKNKAMSRRTANVTTFQNVRPLMSRRSRG